MNKILLIALFNIAIAISVSAQCPEMPSGYLCVSREAVQAGLEAGDRVKALETEIKARDEADKVIRKALDDMRIEFARVSGENTALRQNSVSDRAIITAMIPMLRQKTFGIKIF